VGGKLHGGDAHGRGGSHPRLRQELLPHVLVGLAAGRLDALTGLPLTLPPGDDATTRSAWHHFVVRVADRDRVREDLAARGVETLVHYPAPPFAQPGLAEFARPPGTYPIAERLAAEVLSLPVGPHLGEDGADQVVEALGAALNR
jgi:dTDP-4-amino-4,6-dideoxygalactose transaminase